MLATVCIPTYNRINILLKTLKYWQNQTIKQFELLIIDDNSTDNTYELLIKYKKENNFDNLIIIKNERNYGSAYGRNIGILYSKAPIVIYTDDDTFVYPNYIENHLKFHQKYNNLILRGPIVNFNNLDLLNLFFSNNFQKYLRIIKGYSRNYFCTANVSIRKELILKAGLFNLDFYRWQDTELGYRLRKLGLKRVFSFSIPVFHFKEDFKDLDKIKNHYYQEGKYAAKLVKIHNNLSTKLRTAFIFPNTILWNLFYKKNSNVIKNIKKEYYIRGFLDEYYKK
ncbi:MAG: glycosyltransferase family 2 protein [bacterium]|jgi:GT2 family glycosyltransferase